MEPQLILLRLETQCQSPSPSHTCCAINSPRAFEGNHFTCIAKWDVNHPFNLAMLEKNGVLQTYTLETTGGESKAYLYPCGSFQLYIDLGSLELHRGSKGLQSHIKSSTSSNKNNNDGIASLCLGHGRKWNEEPTRTRPIEQAWGSFEFIPQRRSEIIFFQDGSSRILFAKLPGGSPRSTGGEICMAKIDTSKSKVYCVGRHSSAILSIAVRGDGLVLVSAARDGQLRIWRICDGIMLAQTMFSRWRQPRSPREGKGANSPFRNDNVEVEMDQMAATMQVLSFLGRSQDFCMGCPNGEVRMWNLVESENTRLRIEEVENVVAGNVMVGKDVITALALHVPDCNFPMQYSDGDTQTCSHSHEAFIAIGTIKQKLQVWNKHTILSEWIPLWSTTLSIEGASIVSLSFRADGGLLAIAASRFVKPVDISEYANSSCTPPSKSQKHPCERLYLYSTSSWECVRWLSFTSSLGSCLFYHPQFKVEDKDEPSSSTSQDKVWSCRLLLVSTSSGPQTHILPDFGLLGSIQDQCEQNGMEHLNCRKYSKNIHWADHKGKLASNSPRSYRKVKQQHWEDEGMGEGDGTGRCDTSLMATDMRLYEKNSGSFLAMDVDNGETSFKSSNQRPMQDEEIGLQGLRKVTFHKCKTHPQKIKTKINPRNDACIDKISKQRAHAANLEPRDHTIAKRNNFKKQLPLEIVTQSCKHCKLKTLSVGSGKSHHNNASSSNSFFSLNPSPLEKDGQDNILVDENIPKGEEFFLRTPMDTTTLISSEHKVDKLKTSTLQHQNVEEHSPNTKTKKGVTFMNPRTLQVIPNHSARKIPSSKPTISHSRRKGGKGHFGILTNKKSSCSKNHHLKTCHQEKPSTQDKTKKAARCDPGDAQSHILGGTELHVLLAMNEESSPFKDMVCMGGTFREISPSSRPLDAKAIVVNPSKTHEGKPKLELNRPMACSIASLMQRLQEVEHETFNLKAALQVAKAKGIVLSKHDREEIKSILEEEMNEGSSKCEPEVEGQKSSASYISLLKIPDAQIACIGPFVAPRKVKKQIDVKGEDLGTIQPALFDLWDLHERCPQVSSANLEQANTFMVTSWRRALADLDETNKKSVWLQRADVCRAAASAQAIYDSCLYRPDLEPLCHCHKRDHELFNVK